MTAYLIIVLIAAAQCAEPVGPGDPDWADPCLPDRQLCSSPDINQDGVCNFDDLWIVVEAWGPSDCAIRRRGDLEGDGLVDHRDLIIILEAMADLYDPATYDRCDCGAFIDYVPPDPDSSRGNSRQMTETPLGGG